ncbi:MAG TPA: hypothetical protein P5024_12965 [Burkholderiaceae bacterium]|nr:hypothetical protein [Burkholderiaceae bacterium]HRZ02463.1 hypothetical protein [Burkholderiaceae bacterium]
MKLALFTRLPENLPQSYEWEGQRIATNAGIAFCQPFALDRQRTINQIVIAFKDVRDDSDGAYSLAWEADIVAVKPSAPPYDTLGGVPRYDIFYANARRLEVAPERSRGPGFIRYVD